MNTQPQTYSDLQQLLDEREDHEKYVQRQMQTAYELLTITQLGARAFHHALGGQGQPTLVGEA